MSARWRPVNIADDSTPRLGEASGAALALPMLRAAAAVVGEMGTLQEALSLGSGEGRES